MNMMNDTNITDTFTYTLSANESQDGSTLFDACAVVFGVATILSVANLLCDKWLPINRYDDDEDFEEYRNSLDQAEDDLNGEQEQEDGDIEGGQVAGDVENDQEDYDDEEDNSDDEGGQDDFTEDDLQDYEEEDDDYEEQFVDRYEKILPQKLEQSIVPCNQSRIRFADDVMVREYELPKGQTMAHIASQTNQNSRDKCPSRERLDSVMEFRLLNPTMEPMDIDGPEDSIQQGPAQLRKRCAPPAADARPNKRRRIGDLEDTAASCSLKRLPPSAPAGADTRPNKRAKMTIPSSTKEWVRNINLVHTPPMPVLIEVPEIDEGSSISCSSRSGDNFDEDDDDDLSLGSAFDLEEDGFSDENETHQPLDHSPIAESDDDSIDDNDDVSHQDTAIDQATPPAESSIEPNSEGSIELGSGWTESGKRFSLRLAKRVADEEPTLGSGMTRDGRRFSRRVAGRQVSA